MVSSIPLTPVTERPAGAHAPGTHALRSSSPALLQHGLLVSGGDRLAARAEDEANKRQKKGNSARSE
ncbi:hypothetical protein [Streptomyces sp. NBC_01618]|uniref:hypothetical protein n=1 Tax=Streptomyces sp. NBC_01618 TaxID=2975900 RepID=UPI00386C8C38|nr:hypothetical protein OH735_14665 [Streptomyces sp. NBC_01618]